MSIKLFWPVAQTTTITQKWGESPKNYPLTNGHNGVDFGAPAGTPIYAAHDGQVIRADMDTTGYGNHVRILHMEGWGTVYGHFQALAIGQGKSVKAGDYLGEMGSTGNSTGPHLHFELRGNMLSVLSGMDPLPYLVNTTNIVASGVTTVDGLRVRTSPAIGDNVKQYLPSGTSLDFVEIQGDWGRILSAGARWVCLKQGGDVYVRLTTTVPGGGELSDSEKLKRLWDWYQALK